MSDYFLPGQSDPTEFDPDLTYGGHSATVGYRNWEVFDEDSNIIGTVIWELEEPDDYSSLLAYVEETFGEHCSIYPF